MGKGCIKCDVKHKFFGGKSWEKHTQEGAKPLLLRKSPTHPACGYLLEHVGIIGNLTLVFPGKSV